MAERIELPATPAGSEKEQLQQMYSYLYRMAQTLNINMAEIGNVALTDEEQALFNQITGNGGAGAEGEYYGGAYNYAEAETLKSLIIKTANFVKTETDNYRLILFGEESADSQYGNWIRKKGLRVDVTPDGVKQTYSYAEIIKGLKTYEVNAKNYIKTGLLRTVGSIPVYGVAIGKDVVTFAEDGTETYNDGNKVAELTADELSFYQGGNKVASYTGSKISFFYNGVEAMYIQNGKIYCVGDMEIASGKSLIIKSGEDTAIRMDGDGILMRTPGRFYLHAEDASNSAIIFGSDPETPLLSISESGDIDCKSLRIDGAEAQRIIVSNNEPTGNNIIWIRPTPAGTEKEWDKYPDYLYFESDNCSIEGGGHSHDYEITYSAADYISGDLIYSVNVAVYFYNLPAAGYKKLKARLKNGSGWIDIGITPDTMCVNGTTLRLNTETAQAEANVMDQPGGTFTLRLECNAPTNAFRIALQDIVLKAKTSSTSGFSACSVFYKE